MLNSIPLGIFILGAIFTLVAVLGSGFEVFGTKITGTFGRAQRLLAGLAGVSLIILSIIDPFPRYCWRTSREMPAHDVRAINAANAEVRVVARGTSVNQAIARTRLRAIAVIRCWRCTLASPM